MSARKYRFAVKQPVIMPDGVTGIVLEQHAEADRPVKVEIHSGNREQLGAAQGQSHMDVLTLINSYCVGFKDENGRTATAFYEEQDLKDGR